MKIAIFSDSVSPIINGVSVSIDQLVQELRDLGHSVYIFGPYVDQSAESDPNVYRFRSLRLPWSKGVPVAFPPYLRTLRLFRRHKFDVIHTHTIGTISFVGLRWAQSHEIPIVATYHTLYDRYTHYFPVLPKRYVRFKIAKHTNYVFNRVDQIITPSEVAKRWLLRHSIERPITVIPTRIRPAKVNNRSEVRQKFGIAPHQKVMLFVGRLAEEKNMETLLRACSEAMSQNQDLRLWIVGDGPYSNVCHATARRLGIGDKVKFVGFVPRDEVDNYYAMADFFVFASVTETQGLVVQEAMAYGLPPAMVEGGGASVGVIHGKNGLLTGNNPQQLASAMLRLATDDDLYFKLSEEAKRTARDCIQTSMAEQVLQVYQAAISSSHVKEEAYDVVVS